MRWQIMMKLWSIWSCCFVSSPCSSRTSWNKDSSWDCQIMSDHICVQRHDLKTTPLISTRTTDSETTILTSYDLNGVEQTFDFCDKVFQFKLKVLKTEDLAKNSKKVVVPKLVVSHRCLKQIMSLSAGLNNVCCCSEKREYQVLIIKREIKSHTPAPLE